MLEDTADVTIDTKNKETTNDVTEYDSIENELEEVVEVPREKDFEEDLEPTKKVDFDDDDTLESDLFDLIDSMYDNREDGEK